MRARACLQQDDDIVDAEADDSQDSAAARRDGDDETLDYDYLLDMSIRSLTKPKKEALLAERDRKVEELYQLQKKTPKDLWREDLDAFMKQLQVALLTFHQSCFGYPG